MADRPEPSELVARIVRALSSDERVLGARERQLVQAIASRLAATPDERARDASLRALGEAVADVVGRRLVGSLAAAVTQQALGQAFDAERVTPDLTVLEPEPVEPIDPPPFFPPDNPPFAPVPPAPEPQPAPEPAPEPVPIPEPPAPPPPPPAPEPVPDPTPPVPGPVIPGDPIFPPPSFPPIPTPPPFVPLPPFQIPPFPIPPFGPHFAEETPEALREGGGEVTAPVGAVDDAIATEELEHVAASARSRQRAFKRVADVAPADSAGGYVTRAARTLADVGDLGETLEATVTRALGALGTAVKDPLANAELVAVGRGEGHAVRPPAGGGMRWVLVLSEPPPGSELRVHTGRPAGEALAPTERFQPIALAPGRLLVYPAPFFAALVPGTVKGRAFKDHLLVLVGHTE